MEVVDDIGCTIIYIYIAMQIEFWLTGFDIAVVFAVAI
jgi:hypothetical protein